MQREAEGYNYSIYLMGGMPYLCAGTVGFFVYRGMRRQKGARPPEDDLPGPA